MKKLWILLAFLGFIEAKPLKAAGANGAYYYEICVDNAVCTLGVVTSYGQLGILVRKGQQVPGLLLGDVWKAGPSGDLVASVSDAYYQHLKSNGLRTYHLSSTGDIGREIDQIDREIWNGAVDCAYATLGCAIGAGGAIGTGGWTIGAAMIACLVAKRQCESISRTNQTLRDKKNKLKEELAKEAKEKNPEGTGGAGGEGGQASGANPGGMEVPPIVYGPLPGGKVTGSEGGGGSGPHKPIIFN